MANGNPGLGRLVAVMHRLRRECPWDREQSHHSLVSYLVEETCEVVEAIENGSDADLREELGDLLLQVVFHAAIAEQEQRFNLDDVAAEVADKLIRRHPYVFSDDALPEDLHVSWEQRKRAEKSRRSALDGVPRRLSALVRAQKVLSRAASHGVWHDGGGPETGNHESGIPGIDKRATFGSEAELGQALLALAAGAQRDGLDAEQALRAQLRELENQVTAREQRSQQTPASTPAGLPRITTRRV